MDGKLNTAGWVSEQMGGLRYVLELIHASRPYVLPPSSNAMLCHNFVDSYCFYFLSFLFVTIIQVSSLCHIY